MQKNSFPRLVKGVNLNRLPSKHDLMDALGVATALNCKRGGKGKCKHGNKKGRCIIIFKIRKSHPKSIWVCFECG